MISPILLALFGEGQNLVGNRLDFFAYVGHADRGILDRGTPSAAIRSASRDVAATDSASWVAWWLKP